jgi:hypothetical protein
MLNDLFKKGFKKVEFQSVASEPILSAQPAKNQSDEATAWKPIIPLPLHFKKGLLHREACLIPPNKGAAQRRKFVKPTP